MVRRVAAVAAGVVLFAEAFGVFMLLMTVGIVVENQSMSLDGLDPAMMSGGALGFGIFSAVFLAGCGLVLLLVGVRDRAPARFARILLVVVAVVHGVLGALTVGLVGWEAFAVLMVVLALIVFTLVAYGPGGRPQKPEAQQGAGSEQGEERTQKQESFPGEPGPKPAAS
ncbi:hypothetical protein [Streptomyces albidoflavus]|uniref:hypothetical protein n=1 Tax=Streptomyces albidoflavus TaxID=1886 RepID=UPI000283040D|nr:hypothetical protein [Streptomyces albidoflavus]AMM10702.1 integral membrane protein [Streptomyces albidoflavus]